MIPTQKYIWLSRKWAPSVSLYGTSAVLAFLYVSDWRAVVKYVPYYGSKFQD